VTAKPKAEAAPKAAAAKAKVTAKPKAEAAPKATAAKAKVTAKPKAEAPAKASAKTGTTKPAAKRAAAKAPAPKRATSKAAAPKPAAKAAKAAPKAKAPSKANSEAKPATPRISRTRSKRREKLPPDRLEILVEAARKSLEDDKAENILVLDVTGRADYTDRLIIATGQVERQLQAMASHLDEALGKAGLHLRRDAIQASPDWVLIDAGDLVIHLFRPDARELYRLERMWGPESPSMTENSDAARE
jgi:ribosome silencing factor RsfS/YbeB/iojap